MNKAARKAMLAEIPEKFHAVYAEFERSMDASDITPLTARALLCLGLVGIKYEFDAAFTLNDWQMFCHNIMRMAVGADGHEACTCGTCAKFRENHVSESSEDAPWPDAHKNAGKC